MPSPALDPLLLARAATALTVVAVPLSLLGRHRGQPRLVAVTKALASAGFVAVGFLLAPADPAFALVVRVGLVLSLVGDLFLVGTARRWVLCGLAAFLLAHLLFAGAAAHLWLAAPQRAALALLVGLPAGVAAWRWIVPHGGEIQRAVAAYLVTVSLSLTALLGACAADPQAPGRLLVGAAGALLWVSDLAVARQRLMVDSIWNRVWGLPCYYAGQLLLAWSLAWVRA